MRLRSRRGKEKSAYAFIKKLVRAGEECSKKESQGGDFCFICHSLTNEKGLYHIVREGRLEKRIEKGRA